MTNITPPRELISQWLDEFYDPAAPSGIIPGELTIHIVTQAAQWGADQELDACVKWSIDNQHPRWAKAVQAARRPKPPSLKEQAMQAWCRFQASDHTTADEMMSDFTTIRRALEQLND